MVHIVDSTANSLLSMFLNLGFSLFLNGVSDQLSAIAASVLEVLLLLLTPSE